jgi:cytochrome c5
MRERLARGLALLTAAFTVLLALAFARIQNPAPLAVEVPAAAAPPRNDMRRALADAGRAVYEDQGCAMCHSIAGVGNPRYPLDGVGDRREPADIRKWIVGAAELEDRLPPRAFRMKQDYQELSPGDLDALVAFMEALRN